MRLSIEAKVGAAVATAFIALAVGVIGREQSGNQAGGLTRHDSMSSWYANTSLNRQSYDSSLIADTNTEPDEGN